MRSKFSYVLPGLLGLMLALALSASAQDDVPGPSTSPNNSTPIFNQDPTVSDDKPLLMDQGFKSPMDSLQLHKAMPAPAAKQKSESKKAQAEGDPLNFNFLQYIIQKFKASELMME
ncbi:MAG TPA: hypothetical protein VF473_09430 [Cyclobacteriaceae bacterium]